MRVWNWLKSNKNRAEKKVHITPCLEPLESRVLLSADVIGMSVSSPLQLGPEQFVQAGGTNLQVVNYSVPALADWNSDGLPDLLVGEKFDTVSGKIRVYLNSGTATAPVFGSFSYVQAAGTDLVLPATGCLGAYPRFFDWNQDGRKDLLVGRADGTIQAYLNAGTAANPAFMSGSLIQAGDPGAEIDVDVGDRATFDIIDWNNDGAMDLVAGGLDGKVRVYLNRQASGVPDLASPVFVLEAGADLVVPYGRSSVDVCDFNLDGAKDLLLGNTNAELVYYPNVGTDAAPVFNDHQLVGAITGGSRSRPFVGDFNGDGTVDVLVGNVDGLVRYYICSPSTPAEEMIGYTTVFQNISTIANRRAVAVTASQAGTIESISIYHQGGTGHAILAVYGDTAGKPGTRLGITASTVINSTEGWQTIALQSPVTVSADQTIWLAFVFENDPGLRWTTGTPGRAISSATWSGGMPDSFGTSTTEVNSVYSVYATYSTQQQADPTVGYTTVFQNISTVANRRAVAVVVSQAGTIESISIYHNGGTGQAILAVYDDTAGKPGTRLGITASTVINSTEGWQTIALQSPVTVSAGQTIWLAFVFENDPGLRWTTGTPGRAISSATWSGGMPDSFGTSTTEVNSVYSIYATYSTQQQADPTVGYTTVFQNMSSVANRRAVAVTASQAGTIESISIYHNGGTGHAILAVYGDTAGKPGTRLGITASTVINSTEGWQTIALQSPVAVSSGQTIWLAWVFEYDTAMRWTTGTPGRAISTATWSGGMPDSFGASLTEIDAIYSIYATYSQTTVTPVEVTVDNRDPGASFAGTWNISGGLNPWSTDSMVSWVPGSTCTWTANLVPGTAYNVYAWWTESFCRNPAVPYEIYSGSTLLGTVHVDQITNGGKWNLLGTYTFTGAASVKVLAAPTVDYSTNADAIRFVPVV